MNDSSHRHSWTHILAWILATLACSWIAFCTAIGPIYRNNATITNFSISNLLLFLATLGMSLGLVYAISLRRSQGGNPASTKTWGKLGNWLIRHTAQWWQIMLFVLVGWLWAWVTLVACYGADLLSQDREVSSWLATMHGAHLPYLQGFTIMDVYPTAHYLWPAQATYLTDQHNIFLTILYGGGMALSRKLTGVPDLGIAILSGLQLIFAAYCCGVTANRFFQPASTFHITSPKGHTSMAEAGPLARFCTLAFFLLCPLVIVSTISLTKSPLFAWAFLWWIGVGYEIYLSRINGRKLPVKTLWALVFSSSIMLISAKYALYLLVLQLVLALITDRKHWATYLVCLGIPVIVFQCCLGLLFASGAVIKGDPIEARGIQLQQISRVAQRNPSGIPNQARQDLEPIMDLHAAGRAYFPNDADKVKSSGGEGKTVVYRWKTVTANDMKQLNRAWLQIGQQNPAIYMDAFLAESYGYFDLGDTAYVPMSYYVNNGYVQQDSAWISHWCHNWRDFVAGFASSWSEIPVIGWFARGNFWVIATLILIACELVRGRWKDLYYQLPLLVLMGVMITSPANNFERHMLPLVFAFPFLLIAFHRCSLADEQTGA
ncbi:DUF6020 family protein [Bombiscardovia coagulans]|uniref:Beta-carotene 15,15'-monooxygenase n=1 Tax=Bombiscardovia coagulans TaxID=686666 RepID=A0A261EQH8_9BIFI|nr:DUF6020 family protein [Bombiscardovia coagulans]OZG48936.1 hypothetical protein BOCO_1172 [Bombiscardovia coagulans]